MALPSVSVIMSVANRPDNLRRTLTAWSLIDYPSFDFTVIDNGTPNAAISSIVNTFKNRLHINLVKEPKITAVNILYNKYGKASTGEYIVFAMMDEIISHTDVLQKMVVFEEHRATLATVFLTGEQTKALDTDWKEGFLPSLSLAPWEVAPQAATMGHITGNYRKNWEWFGWYRDHQTGHLWVEQDIHIREVCLGKIAQSPSDAWCYHQAHEPSIGTTRPGYAYHTEAQARLLEPAPSESEG